MNKIISVTKKDIQEGRTASASFCPVALAIKRTLRVEKACVSESGIDIYPAGLAGRYTIERVSRSVQDFVRKFDGGKPVKPFKFKLRVRKSK